MNWTGSGFIPIIIYASTAQNEPSTNDFLLLAGTDFKLLDGSIFLLLGS